MKKEDREELIKGLEALKDAANREVKALAMARALDRIEQHAVRLKRVSSVLEVCREHQILEEDSLRAATGEFDKFGLKWKRLQEADDDWWRRVDESWLDSRILEEQIEKGIFSRLAPLRNEINAIHSVLQLRDGQHSQANSEFEEYLERIQAVLNQSNPGPESVEEIARLQEKGKVLLESASQKGLDPDFLQFIKRASKADGVPLEEVSDAHLQQINENGLGHYVRLKFQLQT